MNTQHLDQLTKTFHPTSLPTAQQMQRLARYVFEAQCEREPTPDELRAFVASGDASRALDDGQTWDNLASLARKAGRFVRAAKWESVGALLLSEPDAVFDAALRIIEGAQ